MRRRWLRLLVAVGLVALAALQIEGLVRTLHGETRVREQALRLAREAVLARRDGLAAALLPGGDASFHAAALLLPLDTGASLEIFDESRHLLFALPGPASMSHWPSGADLEMIRKGGAMTWGPFVGDPSEIATYLALTAGRQPVIARIVTLVPGFLEEERAQRQAATAHGIALGLLLLVGVLILRPAPTEDLGPGAALRAYEEAMGRLQQHGARVSQEHEAERLRLRTELDDKDAMARAGELTAGIVHEVRNGLGTIVGYARLIERSESSPDAQDAAREIRDECATLETVVRRFVDFVKRETLSLAPLDLGRMLGRVAAREGRARPGVAVVLPDPMPEQAVVGDEEMLERAFENLIRNACEAAGEGGHVWVDIERGEDEIVRVHMADDGPGISPERREVIRPFTTSKGGLGLGLPIALKIIRLHGGSLLLGDRPPRGLLVTVELSSGGPDPAGNQA
jgi:signal transduction histidine kinase